MRNVWELGWVWSFRLPGFILKRKYTPAIAQLESPGMPASQEMLQKHCTKYVFSTMFQDEVYTYKDRA